jgi:hypothetical protein
MSKPKTPPRNVHFWRKLGLQAAIVVLVAGLLGFGIYKAYGAWRLSALMKEARAHFAKGDVSATMLTIRRVVEVNPGHRDANLLAAEATEKAGLPDAVGWRQRVAQLSPRDAAAHLAWARTAARFGQFASARVALDGVPPADRANAHYQQLAGGVSVGLGKPKEAGAFYAEAFRLEPASELHQFNHASWRLEFDPDPARKTEADAALNKLTGSASYGVAARRVLMNYAATGRKWDAALAQSSVLTKNPGATPPDWATHLNALAALKHADLETELARGQAAAKEPLLATAILHWMHTHGRTEAALAWAARLDPKVAADPNVAVVVADGLEVTQQWERLRAHTREGDWKDKEALRFAYTARAQRQLGDLAGAGVNWIGAAAAARSPDSAEQLILRAARWGWKREAVEVLWKMAEGPHAAWALSALHRRYQSELDAEGLLRVATKLAELDPANDAARNNVAALSLLLDRKIEESVKMAAQLHAAHPKSIGIASTHAFALHKSGHGAEGLKILQSFKPEELRHPAIAVTYGLLLAEAGRPEAREFLEIAAKAPLLPQEKTLVEKALASLK